MEAAHGGRVLFPQDVARDDLDGHAPAGALVLRLVDSAHAALTQEADKLILFVEGLAEQAGGD
jgi:hypothetical protein